MKAVLAMIGFWGVFLAFTGQAQHNTAQPMILQAQVTLNEPSADPIDWRQYRDADRLPRDSPLLKKKLTEGKRAVKRRDVDGGLKSTGGVFAGIVIAPNALAFKGAQLMNSGLVFQGGKLLSFKDMRSELQPWCTIKFVSTTPPGTNPVFHYDDEELIERFANGQHESYSVHKLDGEISQNITTWIQVNHASQPSKTIDFMQCSAGGPRLGDKYHEPTLGEIRRALGPYVKIFYKLNNRR